MKLQYIRREILDKAPNLRLHIADKYYNKWLKWIIDKKYRKSVNLRVWMSNQVNSPSQDLQELANSISDGATTDETVLNVLAWTINNIDYVTDSDQWDYSERWSEAQETLENKQGDCEDGAILMYVLCRLKGVPSSRLYVFAGDVKGGGHAWLAYRPDEYPLNWAFLDWCYEVTTRGMSSRQLFYVKRKDIQGFYHRQGEVIKDYEFYRDLWFAFNEDFSHSELTYSL